MDGRSVGKREGGKKCGREFLEKWHHNFITCLLF